MTKNNENLRLGQRVAGASILASCVLSAGNIWVGYAAGSTSVLAAGFEFLGDVLASILVLVGMILAAKPADADHPYGHGRIEILAGLSVGIILAAGGLGICFRSLQKITEVHPPPVAAFFGWSIARRIIELRLEERVTERMRIAGELHDTLIQTIHASQYLAGTALMKPDDPMGQQRALETLSKWLQQAVQEGRAALNSLRESTTERNDLAEAFERAINDCRGQGDAEVSLSVAGKVKEMHPVVREEIYRIGYESIRNACAHASASQVHVEVRYAQDLDLRIRDNGVGIDPGLIERGKEGHFGLQGMRERPARIGGKLTLASNPASGTEIKLVVPGGIVFKTIRSERAGALTKFRKLLARVDFKIFGVANP